MWPICENFSKEIKGIKYVCDETFLNRKSNVKQPECAWDVSWFLVLGLKM